MAAQSENPAIASELPGSRHDAEKMEPSERSNDQSESRDRKAAYAVTLQKACNTALQRVKNNNIVANSNWAAPLAAAPSAISTMAILLKTAEMKAAAGLEIESQDVKDEEGNVKGKLPLVLPNSKSSPSSYSTALRSKYFHTNLQHCSDVGRLAFLDAQHSMNNIRGTARGMIAEEGTIAYIIDLLEDPEDARYNLKPEIKAIRDSAKKCLENAQAVASKFQYWHLVICHLRQTSLSKRGDIIKEKEDTDTKKTGAEADEVKFHEEKKKLEAGIELMQGKLQSAERNVERSQVEVDRLRYDPILPEPSVWEDIERVRRLVPSTGPQMKERGMMTGFKDAVWGKSSQHEAEDEAIRKAHAIHVQKLVEDAMTKAREQRDYQRKLASGRLTEARENERKTTEELNTAIQELSASQYQLSAAKANLAKTQGELKRLSNKEMELTSIMEILDESTRQLGKLKEQIEPLVDFFRSILSDIHNNVEENLEAFLRPIIQGIGEGSNPQECEAIRISRRSKERILTTALQMQGRFSAMTDISTAYITISSEYIRPAINRMESLSTVNDSEWSIRSAEFFQWCDSSMNSIDEIARVTNINVQRNIDFHINALHRRAIEGADENDRGH
ncbi:hypothetical protein MMC11_004636 [Xylographa trunciseda]|nr:hypothetical protein [Xylographa trunciseda]